MASTALSWSALRPLRPVLIAGAAAVAWLSFAAPAADASTQHSQESLLGGIASTVSSTLDSEAGTASVAPGVQKAVHAVAAVPARHAGAVTVPAPASALIPQPQPEPASSAPVAAPHALPSLVHELAAPAEAVTDALPSAKVLPAGTATQLTAPVTALADKAVGGIAETVTGTVVRPVADAAPALEAPLESITDVLSETPPLAAPALAPVVEVVENLATTHVSDVVLPRPAVPGSASSDRADSVRVSNGHSPGLGSGPRWNPRPKAIAAFGCPAFISPRQSFPVLARHVRGRRTAFRGRGGPAGSAAPDSACRLRSGVLLGAGLPRPRKAVLLPRTCRARTGKLWRGLMKAGQPNAAMALGRGFQRGPGTKTVECPLDTRTLSALSEEADPGTAGRGRTTSDTCGVARFSTTSTTGARAGAASGGVSESTSVMDSSGASNAGAASATGRTTVPVRVSAMPPTALSANAVTGAVSCVAVPAGSTLADGRASVTASAGAASSCTSEGRACGAATGAELAGSG